MSLKNDTQKEQNIDEILKMLRESFPENANEGDNEIYVETDNVVISEEELDEELRVRFMTGSKVADEMADVEDTYVIDEEFLVQADEADEIISDSNENDVASEEIDSDDDITFDEIEDVPDENDPVVEAIELIDEDDDITFDEIEDVPDENDPIVEAIELVDEDDDITFDEIEDVPDENDPVVEAIELIDEDDDITFDEIEDLPDENDPVVEAIELIDEDDDITFDEIEDVPDENDPVVEAIELSEEHDVGELESDLLPLDDDTDVCEPSKDELDDMIAKLACERSLKQFEDVTHEEDFVALEEFVDDLFTEQVAEDTDAPEERLVDGEFLDEMFSEDGSMISSEDSTLLDSLAKSEPDGAEISLLLQLGCQDEIIERYSKESLGKVSNGEILDDIVEEDSLDEPDQTPEERILASHELYRKTRGGLLVRMGVAALISLVLLIYEGLPVFDMELPGILNRYDYSIVPYVLIALSLVFLCGITSYKQLWSGLKKLVSPKPDIYSMIALLGITELVYDISAFFAEKTVPNTYHFVLTLGIFMAVLCEYLQLSAEKRSFEFYFSNVIYGESSLGRKCFTLCKSEGEGSVAEKMYSGGMPSNKNVYYPMEVDSEIGFFRAVANKSDKTRVPMLAVVPAIAFAIIVGIVALFVSGEIWTGLAGLNLALFFALPLTVAVIAYLPFEILGRMSVKNGYSFATDGSIDRFADGDVMIFSDMHMFAKCTPSAVNLAPYDSTSKDILLGVLNAVYSEIGGPMSETFTNAKDKRFDSCYVVRAAKNGVETIVGKNYSVLVGTEAFMLRYGIAFPKITLKNESDSVHTLCVSINGRASARLAVRYSVNEAFEMFVTRLAEDGVHCAIQTLDPMISVDLMNKLRGRSQTQVSIVHLNADDHVADKTESRKILFDAAQGELDVSAHGSRFNLVVAMSAAKTMNKIHKYRRQNSSPRSHITYVYFFTHNKTWQEQ